MRYDRAPRAWWKAGRVGRWTLALLALLTGSGVGPAWWQRSQCATRDGSPTHPAHAGAHQVQVGRTAADPGGPLRAWVPASPSDCTHCPATECARMAPCSAASTTAISSVVAELRALPAHRVAMPAAPRSPRSPTHQPLTPPPQPVA